jgi:hypothetical protein
VARDTPRPLDPARVAANSSNMGDADGTIMPAVITVHIANM